MKMSDEYKTSCEDELDWKDVDQLHQAILQISKSCFEYKKLCVGFFGIAIALSSQIHRKPPKSCRVFYRFINMRRILDFCMPRRTISKSDYEINWKTEGLPLLNGTIVQPTRDNQSKYRGGKRF